MRLFLALVLSSVQIPHVDGSDFAAPTVIGLHVQCTCGDFSFLTITVRETNDLERNCLSICSMSMCARMCETKKHMCKQTCACARKRVNVRMHVHGRVFSSALLSDICLSPPRAAGRSAHQHVYASQLACCSGRRSPRVGGSRTRGVTRVRRRWCDAREIEGGGVSYVPHCSTHAISMQFQ